MQDAELEGASYPPCAVLAEAARSCPHCADELSSTQSCLTAVDALKLASEVAGEEGGGALPPRTPSQPALTFTDFLEFIARTAARLDLVDILEDPVVHDESSQRFSQSRKSMVETPAATLAKRTHAVLKIMTANLCVCHHLDPQDENAASNLERLMVAAVDPSADEEPLDDTAIAKVNQRLQNFSFGNFM